MSLHRNIRLLAWFNFFEDFRPYAPFVVLYFAQETGSYTLAMAVLSVSMISSSVFEVPTGLLSDMIGRRRTMMFGSLAGTVCVLLWAIGGSFGVLALGSVFAGLSTAFFSGNNNAFLHDTLKQEGREREYSHFLGRTSALFQVGLGTSALIGGLFAERALSYAMWAGVIPQMVCVALTFFMFEPRVHNKESTANVFHHLREAFRRFRENARLRALSLASILDYGVGQAQWEFIPAFFAALWPLWAVGVARTLAHTAAFVSFWFAGRVIRWLEPFKALMIGKATSHVVVLLAYGMKNVLSPLLIASMSIFFGVKLVSENTLLQREFTDQQRATMGSMTQFAGSIVFAVAALAFGVLADNVGPVRTLMISEVLLSAGLLLYWKAFRHR